MADIVDTPSTETVVATQTSPARLEPVAPGESVDRPLTALAFTGFALAVLYALFIAGSALFAFSSGYPVLLMPLWTIVLPVAVLLTCWLARRSVMSSNGMVRGKRLATAGMLLTGVIGLGYWAYYTSTLMALRQQAAELVESQFLAALVNGKVEEAFLLTLNGPRPPVDANLRDYIEKNLNVPPNTRASGFFTRFSESPFVRSFQTAGETAKVRLKGIGTPSAGKQSVQVPVTYAVETPFRQLEILIVPTATSAPDESSGRRWYIELTAVSLLADTRTERGIRTFQKLQPTARLFINSWIAKLVRNANSEEAYRATLPPEERQKVIKLVGDKRAEQFNAEKENNPEVRNYLDGLEEFRNGALVRNEDRFYVADALRADVVNELKKRFRSGFLTLDVPKLSTVDPTFQTEGGKIRFVYEFHLQLPPGYEVDTRVTVEGDSDALQNSSPMAPSPWRLVGIELVRAYDSTKLEKGECPSCRKNEIGARNSKNEE
jgi:hypothetical protein